MKLVVEKIICGSTVLNSYILRIEDTDTDEFYDIEVDSQKWEDYNEGDEYLIYDKRKNNN